MKKLFSLILLVSACSAQAQTAEFVNLVPEAYLPKDVNFSLGGAVLFIPKYKGSDEHRVAAYPCSTRNGKMARFSAHSTAWAITSRKTPTCNTAYACRWKQRVTESVLANCVDSAMSALRWSLVRS